MCGILGVLRGDAGRTSRERFAEALELIRHRGPDSRTVLELGPVLLGHARLRIIDLSDAARQPLYDVSGRYVIVYNGEVYNYPELRAELERLGHRFASHSDTEVVVEAYKAWGERCLERFNGMFAFFLYDTESRRGFAARDRFGVKPFYWARVGGDFVFGSEVKPLLALGAGREPDLGYIQSCIVEAATDHGDGTMLKGVRQLAGNGEPVFRRWWDPAELFVAVPRTYPERVERYRELLEDAVRLRLRSDVQNAMTLSGGMDSTSVYASYERLRASGVPEAAGGRDLRPYTIRYAGSPIDEVPDVEALVGSYGRTCRYVDVDRGAALSHLWDSLYYLEFPAWNISPIAYLQVYRALQRDGIRVLLEGHGNDEILGGYYNHINLAIASFLRAGQWGAAYDAARAYAAMRHTGVGQFPVPPLVALLYNALPGARRLRQSHLSADLWRGGLWDPALRLEPLAVPEVRGATGFTNHLLHAFHTTILPTVLRVFDRATMASSVEMRAPFLDYRLVQLGFSIPDADKVGGGFQKRILRDAMAGILPERIRTNRRKTAFSGDLVNWLNDPANRAYLATEVLAKVHSGMPLDGAALRRYFDRQCAAGFGWGEAVRFSRAISIVVWWRLFVDGEYRSHTPARPQAAAA
jgi:asparagine synthase (glutamine-hydrolysing)